MTRSNKTVGRRRVIDFMIMDGKDMQISYPVGIQNFPKIRLGGYLYVDKTDLIYSIVQKEGYYFLSRPRRFGKSLLLSTIEAYFEGRRELFRNLAIDSLTDVWESYPVLHLDLNSREYKTPEDLLQELSKHLELWESVYGDEKKDRDVEERFSYVIRRAYEQTGKKVVILVDEYDKPMLNAIMDEELSESYRSTLKAFYGNLKSSDRYIRFAMLTGVARFSKVSIFSDLNNLRDISFLDEYSSICGISNEEVDRYFKSGIERLAAKYRISYDEARREMRQRYDGYHFSEYSVDVYNPFSLMNLFANNKFENYWSQTGTPTHVVELLKSGSWDVGNLSGYRIKATRLSTEGITSHSPIPTLFQAGYLTISHYRPDIDQYTLDYPNREVKESFLDFLLGEYTSRGSAQRTDFDITRFVEEVEEGNPKGFMERVTSLLAAIPYSDHPDAPEAYFQSVIYMLFTLLGYYTEMEERTARGRIDVTVKTSGYIYVFEFKRDGSAEDAMAQIHEKEYWRKFASSGHRIFLIAANFNSRTRSLDGLLIEELPD